MQIVVDVVRSLLTVLTSRRRDPWDRAVAATAAALDLHGIPGPDPGGSVVRGTRDGIAVSVDRHAHGNAYVTRIRATGGQPSALRIRPETGGDTAWGARDAETGDAGLDAAALFDGEATDLLRARLDADTRRAVLGAVALGARLSGGEWTLDVAGDVPHPDRLEALTRTVLDAARALAGFSEPRERLRRIAATDPVDRVRLNALASLIGRRPDSVELEPFLRDRDPRIAVLAARATGSAGQDVLRSCLQAGDEAVRRSAALGIACLPPGPGTAEAETVLLSLLRDGETDVIDGLARIGSAASVPALGALAGGLGLRVTERHARRALRMIRARLAGGERGTVALSDSVDGRLSAPSAPHRRES